jgi:hypothetical protein
MAAAGSHGACRVCPKRLAASAPMASRPTIPGGASLLGVVGSLSPTSSLAAATTKSRLVRGSDAPKSASDRTHGTALASMK